MNYALILDQEHSYANCLRKHLQKQFPELFWITYSSCKQAYLEEKLQGKAPLLCLYNQQQFQNWLPPWPTCHSLALSEHLNLNDCFPLFPSDLLDQVFDKQAVASSTKAVYKLNHQAIDDFVQQHLTIKLDEKKNNTVSKIHSKLFYLSQTCFLSCLEEAQASMRAQPHCTLVLSIEEYPLSMDFRELFTWKTLDEVQPVPSPIFLTLRDFISNEVLYQFCHHLRRLSNRSNFQIELWGQNLDFTVADLLARNSDQVTCYYSHLRYKNPLFRKETNALLSAFPSSLKKQEYCLESQAKGEPLRLFSWQEL